MRILSIETSCDETAVAILECEGGLQDAQFRLLGNALHSQAEKQSEYGGVYPSLAKREHQANLVPLATEALKEAEMLHPSEVNIDQTVFKSLRDEGFKTSIRVFLESYGKPDIDLIAVTRGPGLEPALWTGINFAESLSLAWGVPLLGIDHMEGHIVSAALQKEEGGYRIKSLELPLMALLISGGHTELILMKEWFQYEAVGRTRDDAVGEAFDKVARLLSLPYPGGPQIAAMAIKSREKGEENPFSFPSPMTSGPTCDFSFSGLKTSVLYTLKKMDKISDTEKAQIAEAFENAAKDALVIQTRKALRQHETKTLVIAGGVSANDLVRKSFEYLVEKEFTNLSLALPDKSLTGDNAIMVGAAAYLRHTAGKAADLKIEASGKLRLEA